MISNKEVLDGFSSPAGSTALYRAHGYTLVGKEKDMASCISNTSLFMKWLPAEKINITPVAVSKGSAATNQHLYVQIGTYR